MANDDVIFETSNVIVYTDGSVYMKDNSPTMITSELSRELARLYRLLEDKEDDGR